MYLSALPSTYLPVRRRPVSIHRATLESQTEPASYFPCRPPTPSPLLRATTSAPPAQSLQFPTRTSGSPSPPASPSSVQPSTPHAALHTKRPRSSASHFQKSRGQTPLDSPPTASPPRVKHAPPNQSRSPPKTPPYTAPSASAPPPQSPHLSETCLPHFAIFYI